MKNQQLEKSIELALSFHKDQKDKVGMPYTGHILRVAENSIKIMKDYDWVNLNHNTVYLAALLHDTLEDCDNINYEYIKNQFCEEIAICCDLLNKNNILERQNRNDKYLARIFNYSQINWKISAMALIIKIADSTDNADVSRYSKKERETSAVKGRTKRYLKNINICKNYLNQLKEKYHG